MIFFRLGIERDPGHVIEMVFLLQERPEQDAHKDSAEQAQRNNAEVLHSAEMSENVLDHRI